MADIISNFGLRGYFADMQHRIQKVKAFKSFPYKNFEISPLSEKYNFKFTMIIFFLHIIFCIGLMGRKGVMNNTVR